METETLNWVWLIVGIVLMIAELVVPGMVLIFLGMGAVLVALGRWFGLIEGLMASFTAWFIISLVLVFGLRRITQKIFPSDISYENIEEDTDAYGKVVEVVETIYDNNTQGRIRFQGTTWPAMSEKGSISKGKKGKLIYRENINWVVEPYFDDEDFDIKS